MNIILQSYLEAFKGKGTCPEQFQTLNGENVAQFMVNSKSSPQCWDGINEELLEFLLLDKINCLHEIA